VHCFRIFLAEKPPIERIKQFICDYLPLKVDNKRVEAAVLPHDESMGNFVAEFSSR